MSAERPETRVIIPYLNQIDARLPGGVIKFYDDPDYINLSLADTEDSILAVSWATKLDCTGSIKALKRHIKPEGLKGEGVVGRWTMQLGRASLNNVWGTNEQIIEIVERSKPGTVNHYSLFDDERVSLAHGSTLPRTFHDIPSKAITVSARRGLPGLRQVVHDCIEDTAMPGLLSDIDTVLDEFSGYDESLRG